MALLDRAGETLTENQTRLIEEWTRSLPCKAGDCPPVTGADEAVALRLIKDRRVTNFISIGNAVRRSRGLVVANLDLLLDEMAARGAGRIVNVTSQVVVGTPTLHWTGYAVAKAALAMLSRNLAAELGPRGVTVNCVSPGMTETGLIGDITEKQQMMIARQTPLRRLAKPEDVASAVAYLVSDQAKFITGHTLDVNGGMVMA